MSPSLRRVAPFALALSVLALSSAAFGQATLMTGLGGPRGYGTSCMPPNDDGSYPLAGMAGLDLTPAFPSGLHFYTGTFTRGWINNNGSLSFNSAISTYTPSAFPGAPQPMIAPYWADVDTRSGSFCTDFNYPVGGAYPAGTPCMNPSTDGVWWSVTPGQIVITWDHVGFFDCHASPTNTFQMILSSATGCGGGTSGMDFDVEFRYNQIGWETGDASGGTGGFGGTPAQAGFDSGDGTNYESLPGSRTMAIATNLVTMSNLTPVQPGVWRFGVRGGMIMCPNAGMACSTGMPGICAQGALTCTGTMMTTCQPFTTAQPSQCNGLDNNCDGMIDDGPCPPGQVCDGSACVSMCVEGSCNPGQTCSSTGLCEDTACVGVTCPPGQRCQNGTCGDGCTGVTCPIGQVCRLGSCVDPCSGLNCGMGQVCENGMCVPSCPCRTCSSGQVCTTDGHCVDMGCDTMMCPAGQVCQHGSCIDACTGAVCPSGQMCTTGMCVASPVTPDAGTDSGSTGTDSGPLNDSGIPRDAGVDAHGDARSDGSSDGSHHNGVNNPGCGCRTAGGSGQRGANAILALLGIAMLAGGMRRRRE